MKRPSDAVIMTDPPADLYRALERDREGRQELQNMLYDLDFRPSPRNRRERRNKHEKRIGSAPKGWR